MIRSIFSLILILGIQWLCAQTFEIAHKSHSGHIAEQKYDGRDRFGEISFPLMRIERIENESDAATIISYGFNGKVTEEYRIHHHPIFNNPSLDMDSVQQIIEGNIEFIGFDEEPKSDKKNELFVLPFRLPPVSGKVSRT